MLVYLDTCAIQRPLDDYNQVNIQIQGNIIITFIELLEAGIYRLVTSAILRYEVESIASKPRRNYCQRVLGLATTNINTTVSIAEMAADYEKAGIKPLDALHLSSAIKGGADLLCTVDLSFLRNAKQLNTKSTKIVSPEELKTILDL